MIDFLSFQNRYLISAVLKLERLIHICKGKSLKPVRTDMPVVVDQHEHPFIPGSSVKGVLRSEIERILRTLKAQQKEIEGRTIWACDSENPCLKREERPDLIDKCTKDGKFNGEKFAKEVFSRLCTACELFGSEYSASHIMIKDMSLRSEGIKTELRDGVAIDRDTGTARQGQLFNFEVVPAGVKFAFEAILENVDEWQVGLFGIVLRLWERGEIAVGGKTSIGMGFGKLENISIRLVDASNLIDHVVAGETQEETIEHYIEIFRTKLEG